MSSAETRRGLLDATLTVLLARGFEGVRVSEIAKEAGVTTGAIYNHFASKTELLTAAISERDPAAMASAMRPDGGASAVETIRQLGRELPTGGGPLAPILLELIATATRDESVAAIVHGQFSDDERASVDLVRSGQNSGEVDALLDAEALARFATMLGIGALVVAALDLKAIDQEAWSSVIDRFATAIQPKEDPS